MDPSRESDGGGSGRTPSPAGPSPGRSPRDDRSAPEAEDVPELSRQVLSLEQMAVTGCSNEYTDGPRAEGLRDLPSASEPPSPASDPEIIRVQPKGPEPGPEELKPLTEAPRGRQNGLHKHWDRCEDCGRCRCPECVRPRVLPFCWLCGRRCMCSAQSAVEYGTCVCCVKGLFYHCSSDDEDTCADKPFSCSQPRCCARWAAVSLLALVFPCLLCYLPARACVHACQSCYDRAARPGCRCGVALLQARALPT